MNNNQLHEKASKYFVNGRYNAGVSEQIRQERKAVTTSRKQSAKESYNYWTSIFGKELKQLCFD